MGKQGSKSNSSPTFSSSHRDELPRNRKGFPKAGQEVVSTSDSTFGRRSKLMTSPTSLSSSSSSSSCRNREGLLDESKEVDSTDRRRSKSKSSPTSLSPSRRVGTASPLDECQEEKAEAPPAFDQFPGEIKVMVFKKLHPFPQFTWFYYDFVKSFIPESLEGFSLIARYAISETEYSIVRHEISKTEYGLAECCLEKLQNDIKKKTIPRYSSKVGSKNGCSLSQTDRILCSAEGLVCVDRETHVMILNPTDQSIIGRVARPTKTTKFLGFGSKINEGYKLIAVDGALKNPYKLYKSNRNSGSWIKNLQGPGDFVYAIQPGKYLNGNIYLLAKKSVWENRSSSVLLVLLRFSYQNETFDLAHLPESIVQMKLEDVCMDSIYNRLAISCKSDESTNVWIANDNGLWIKVYKFPPSSSGLLFVLTHDKVLVISNDSFRLVNPITGAVHLVLPYLKASDSTICFKSHFSP